MDGHDDHSAAQDEDPDDGIRVFPRRKLHEAEHGKVYSEPVRGRPPMTLSLKTVELLFDLPQKDVAARFGISLTAFKQVCRKLGITRWPYRRASKVMEVLTCKLPHSYPSLVMVDCAPEWASSHPALALRCVTHYPWLVQALAPKASPDPDEFDPAGKNNASPSETGRLLSHQSFTASSLIQDHADDSKSVVPPPPSSPLSSPHSGILPMPSLGLGRVSLSGPSKRPVVGRADLPHSMQALDSFPFLDLIGPAFDFDMPFLQTQPSLNMFLGSSTHSVKGSGWGQHMGAQAAESDYVHGKKIDAIPASRRRQPISIPGASPMLPQELNGHDGGSNSSTRSSKDKRGACVEPSRKAAKVQQHSVTLSIQTTSFAHVTQTGTHHNQPTHHSQPAPMYNSMHLHALHRSHTSRLRPIMQENTLSEDAPAPSDYARLAILGDETMVF